MGRLASILGGARQSSMLGGNPTLNARGALIFDYQLLPSAPTVVPAGAYWCEVILVGPGGGGGGTIAATGSIGGNGGGGAVVIGGFPVIPGVAIAFAPGNGGTAGAATPTAGGDGTATTVTYNGVIVASAQGGRGGAISASGGPGVDGLGGKASGCIVPVGGTVIAGQDGNQATIGGGVSGLNAAGNSITTLIAATSNLVAGGTVGANGLPNGNGRGASGGNSNSLASKAGGIGSLGSFYMRFYAS